MSKQPKKHIKGNIRKKANASQVSAAESIADLFEGLSPREQFALYHRFGFGKREWSLDDLGTMLECSRENVRRVIKSCLEKLRSLAKKHDIPCSLETIGYIPDKFSENDIITMLLKRMREQREMHAMFMMDSAPKKEVYALKGDNQALRNRVSQLTSALAHRSSNPVIPQANSGPQIQVSVSSNVAQQLVSEARRLESNGEHVEMILIPSDDPNCSVHSNILIDGFVMEGFCTLKNKAIKPEHGLVICRNKYARRIGMCEAT